jgi:hypothetical protein
MNWSSGRQVGMFFSDGFGPTFGDRSQWYKKTALTNQSAQFRKI